MQKTSPNQDLIHNDHAIKAKKHLSIQFLFFIAVNNLSSVPYINAQLFLIQKMNDSPILMPTLMLMLR